MSVQQYAASTSKIFFPTAPSPPVLPRPLRHYLPSFQQNHNSTQPTAVNQNFVNNPSLSAEQGQIAQSKPNTVSITESARIQQNHTSQRARRSKSIDPYQGRRYQPQPSSTSVSTLKRPGLHQTASSDFRSVFVNNQQNQTSQSTRRSKSIDPYMGRTHQPTSTPISIFKRPESYQRSQNTKPNSILINQKSQVLFKPSFDSDYLKAFSPSSPPGENVNIEAQIRKRSKSVDPYRGQSSSLNSMQQTRSVQSAQSLSNTVSNAEFRSVFSTVQENQSSQSSRRSKSVDPYQGRRHQPQPSPTSVPNLKRPDSHQPSLSPKSNLTSIKQKSQVLFKQPFDTNYLKTFFSPLPPQERIKIQKRSKSCDQLTREKQKSNQVHQRPLPALISILKRRHSQLEPVSSSEDDEIQVNLRGSKKKFRKGNAGQKERRVTFQDDIAVSEYYPQESPCMTSSSTDSHSSNSDDSISNTLRKAETPIQDLTAFPLPSNSSGSTSAPPNPPVESLPDCSNPQNPSSSNRGPLNYIDSLLSLIQSSNQPATECLPLATAIEDGPKTEEEIKKFQTVKLKYGSEKAALADLRWRRFWKDKEYSYVKELSKERTNAATKLEEERAELEKSYQVKGEECHRAIKENHRLEIQLETKMETCRRILSEKQQLKVELEKAQKQPSLNADFGALQKEQSEQRIRELEQAFQGKVQILEDELALSRKQYKAHLDRKSEEVELWKEHADSCQGKLKELQKKFSRRKPRKTTAEVEHVDRGTNTMCATVNDQSDQVNLESSARETASAGIQTSVALVTSGTQTNVSLVTSETQTNSVVLVDAQTQAKFKRKVTKKIACSSGLRQSPQVKQETFQDILTSRQDQVRLDRNGFRAALTQVTREPQAPAQNHESFRRKIASSAASRNNIPEVIQLSESDDDNPKSAENKDSYWLNDKVKSDNSLNGMLEVFIPSDDCKISIESDTGKPIHNSVDPGSDYTELDPRKMPTDHDYL